MRSIRVGLSALLVLGACALPGPDEHVGPPLPHLDQLLDEQSRLHPMMAPEDLYKLVYQATRGPGHLFMGDGSKLDIGLNEEIAKLAPAPAPGEPEVELLDPRTRLARVNLRPFLRAGGRAEDLARAVGRTTHEFHGSLPMFRGSLARAQELLPRLDLGFGRDDFEEFVRDMRDKGYPPGVHSQQYADIYRPAYRLVMLQHLTDKDFGGRQWEPEMAPVPPEAPVLEAEGEPDEAAPPSDAEPAPADG